MKFRERTAPAEKAESNPLRILIHVSQTIFLSSRVQQALSQLSYPSSSFQNIFLSYMRVYHATLRSHTLHCSSNRLFRFLQALFCFFQGYNHAWPLLIPFFSSPEKFFCFLEGISWRSTLSYPSPHFLIFLWRRTMKRLQKAIQKGCRHDCYFS